MINLPEDIVVDTNVIIYAVGGHDASMLPSCARVLYTIIEEDDWRIALDHNCKILEEYKQQLKKQRTRQSQALEELIEQEAYGRGSSSVFKSRMALDEDKVSELAENGFHDNDIIFVRIAPRTDSQTVVSTDGESLLDKEHKEWIKDNLNVDVFSPEDCADKVLS